MLGLIQENPTLGAVTIASILALALVVRSQQRHPHELPTLTTFFPWLGIDNVISFYRRPAAFIESARLKYGPFYKFKAFGANVAVLLHPYSLRQLERVSNDLNDHLSIAMASKAASGLKDVHRVVDILVQHIATAISRELSPVSITNNGIRQTFNEVLARELDKIVLSASGPVSLKGLVCRSMYNATALMYFGPTYPFHTYDDFLIMNSDIPTLTSGMSRIPIFASVKARTRWHAEMMKYLRPWWDSKGEVKIEGASQLIMDVLHSVKDSGYSIEELTYGLLGFSWGTHNNLWFHLYWCMAHSLVDEEIRKALEHEARSYTGALSEPSEIPLIQSVYKEAMRWPFSVGQVRQTEADLNLTLGKENYFVEKGTWIMARNINHCPETYAEPFEFRHKRFMEASTTNHGAYGNGRGLCKGRHFASMQLPDFVVQCFRRYDIKPFVKDKGTPKVPRVVGNPFLPDVATLEDFLIEIKPAGEGQ